MPIIKSAGVLHFVPELKGVPIDFALGLYQIIRRLPPTDDGDCQYEIRNLLEQHNRIARENELTRA